MPLNFQFRSGSGSATQIYSNEWEWECHSKNKGVLNPLKFSICLKSLSILIQKSFKADFYIELDAKNRDGNTAFRIETI